MILLNNIQNVEENIRDRNDFRLSEMLVFGYSSFNDEKTSILIIFNICVALRNLVPIVKFKKRENHS